MSGGGSNGAWEAGVVWGFVNYGNPSDFSYDVITGVSAGATNTAALAVYAPGDELAAMDFLIDTYMHRTSDQVFKKRPEGDALALFDAISIFDTAPGIQTTIDMFAPYDGFKRAWAMSATDMNTGEKVVMTDEDVTWEDFPYVTLSSASVPGFFPPVAYKDHLLADGGIIYNTDVQAAIDRCKKMVGEDESAITIDILQCNSPTEIDVWDKPAKTAYSNYER